MLGKRFLMRASALLLFLVFGVLLRAAWAQPESVLSTFCAQNRSNCPDGGIPYAGLVFDQKGNRYGTTYYGGSAACDADSTS